MSWHARQVARWLRLALACVALALGAGASAHPLPGPEGVVAVLVDRRAPEARRPAEVAPARRRGSTPRIREARAQATVHRVARTPRSPGPPHPLYLLHRALLH
ncbi:hypothetical protein OV208_08575 [Corallococcus sp. bb12-1]|uniref:hypothetical protein n=1 Tax=Corallococcus sp. bb12-1 TaxID=2996784 RepID=UPI00226D907B|nr:hypothetical protein [Corallococcus sp. bb12-1]MCY1041367.1 hypothetical protein [Corallococcus sp. bb12-1]